MMGRIGMYRLMSTAVLSVLLAAIALAAVGIVGYRPGGIAAIAGIAVASTILATVAGARMTGQRPHLESSVITGVLIAFIVPPTLETRDLVGAAVAGAVAGFSKYVLVHRARHFLNPAAIGTAITGLVGLTASFWWIATPPLTPVIAIAGALVAWRSGMGAIALTGLGVGLGVLMVRLLIQGGELWSSVYLAVTSYPLVFLALFMLTEPLTMPGRSLWRHGVAIVVAVAVALPFSFSLGDVNIYSSPEIALVLGNLVALGATILTKSARSAGLALQQTTNVGAEGIALTFGLDRPLPFRAGQWVDIHFAHRASDGRGERRVFSVASSPHRAMSSTPEITIMTRLSTPGSTFKHALSGAAAGSVARVSQVGGDFLLPKNPQTPLLLIAGGVGVTPFLSQLAELTHKGETRDVILVDVRRNPSESWDDSTVQSSGATHVIASRDTLSQVLSDIPDLRSRWCAVSGSPSFIGATTTLLRRSGVRRIATDSFLGY